MSQNDRQRPSFKGAPLLGNAPLTSLLGVLGSGFRVGVAGLGREPVLSPRFMGSEAPVPLQTPRLSTPGSGVTPSWTVPLLSGGVYCCQIRKRPRTGEVCRAVKIGSGFRAKHGSRDGLCNRENAAQTFYRLQHSGFSTSTLHGGYHGDAAKTQLPLVERTCLWPCDGSFRVVSEGRSWFLSGFRLDLHV